MTSQRFGNERSHARFLEFDNQRCVRKALEHLVERRNPLSPSGVEIRQIPNGEIANGAVAVSGPVQHGIVDDHRDIVSGRANVELQRVSALGEALFEREDRVLGMEARRTAMRDDRSRRRIEENHLNRSSLETSSRRRAVPVECVLEVRRDLLGRATFDVLPLQHVDQAAILEQSDLG